MSAVAMIAFLKKAEGREVLPYVHAGCVVALAADGLTWGAATYLVSVSGASRELTEGFSSLFAAIILLGVGIWMHQKPEERGWTVAAVSEGKDVRRDESTHGLVHVRGGV